MAKGTRKLNIVVAVRDQTKKKLNTIQKGFKRFAAQTRAVMNRVGVGIKRAFQAGLAAAAGALAFFVVNIKREFAEIDKLAKTAFRFGIAVEEIRGLELAGKLAGLSLSEMTTILRDTSRRVSEAAQNTGEAQDAIKELGLDAKQLNLMPVSDQLDVILKALEKTENQNDRVRLAYDIMGRSGTQGLTLIGTSIRGAIQDTNLLGTALDNQITTNVQNANDELTRTKEAFKGIVQQAVGSLAPVLESLFKDTRQFLIEVRFGIEAIPLTVEVELLKIKKLFFDLSSDLMGSELGQLLFGKTNASLLQFTGEGVQEQIDQIKKQINDLTRQGGQLSDPQRFIGGPDGDGSVAGPGRGPTPGPGIVGGRLLTGAAQSSMERLAAIQKAADDQRRKEAAEAKKQGEERNRILGELLRGAVQGKNNLGGLLQ